jgi:2-isopropylmalate synthase
MDLSQIDEAKQIVEECNELPVHPRHPYAGELVYTAFSGSHQDAIKKGMYAQQRSGDERWDVPYLLLDPMDVGRTYEAIIRVNSQSGKGGVAYLMETEHHLELPRGLQVDFAQKVQAITDARGDELTADELLAAFHEHYLSHTRPYEIDSYTHWSAEEDRIVARVIVDGEPKELQGVGNGPIAALVDAFDKQLGITISIRDYHEHAMAASADATAAAYVEADVDDDPVWGVGLHPSIVTASLRAVVNGVNRAIAAREAVTTASALFDS